MNNPQLSRQKSEFLSPLTSKKLEELASSHPFTKQLDLIIPLGDPGGDELVKKLTSLECSYREGPMKLGDAISALGDLENRMIILSGPSSSSSSLSQDAWCLDTRGLITLSVGEETYQSLGLTGKAIGVKKGGQDTYAVQLPQQLTKAHLDAVSRWDASHRDERVLYATLSGGPVPGLDKSAVAMKTVKPVVRTHTNVFIPTPGDDIKRTQPTKSDPDALEDWELAIHETFEWTGLAALGAPGIQTTNLSHDYVSSYKPPDPNRTGSIAHLQWRGLLHPQFIKAILGTISSSTPLSPCNFVSLTAHGFTGSPVAYIPHRNGRPRLDSVPVRLVQPDEGGNGEECWCLLIGSDWGIVQERAGFGDMRWG